MLLPGSGLISASCRAQRKTNGVLSPEVSAGSRNVGAIEASKAMVSSPSGRFWPVASPPHVARSRKNEAKTAPAFAIMDSSRAHRDRAGQRYMVEIRATSRASATYVLAPAALPSDLAVTSTLAWSDGGQPHPPDAGTHGARRL